MRYVTAKAIEILMFMQKRMRCRHFGREAKLEILYNAWHKLLGQINENNLIVKNKNASRLIIQIGRIPYEVSEAALDEYLRCSQRVHTIAFLQWRSKYPNEHTKINQLHEIIEARIYFMYSHLKDNYARNLPSDDLMNDEEFYFLFKPSISDA